MESCASRRSITRNERLYEDDVLDCTVNSALPDCVSAGLVLQLVMI